MDAWETPAGRSVEWKGVHHSTHGDFADISTHTVSYESRDRCYVTTDGRLVADGVSYTYQKLDHRMAILIYRPEVYQGRSGVILYSMLDFASATDRAVILADGEPFAIADGTFREVPTPARPGPH
ncbi:hypothetical protein [Salinispora fenicalii]|uniref:hypothetical protein n=1 Tax=Salinispora fenicalii TaxID=1137263 RepID=UPI001CC5F600|nr:hypothetical protein [Salinispora fenicalii]